MEEEVLHLITVVDEDQDNLKTFPTYYNYKIMKSFRFITALSLLSVTLISQNDIDAMRYSQTFFGGTSRSKAMAGSFGALGADGSCMGTNPAGIGLYKKGDING